jgi:hypothetical protein
MLSRDDEDEPRQEDQEQGQENVNEQVEDQRPKRRARNASAFRSRKPRASAQLRTRRKHVAWN